MAQIKTQIKRIAPGPQVTQMAQIKRLTQARR
jgi:hypothetical protein